MQIVLKIKDNIEYLLGVKSPCYLIKGFKC